MSSTTDFPERNRRTMANFKKLTGTLPEVMKGFRGLHESSMHAGALDARTKELMALAISIVQGCEGCIASHMQAALRAGASREEVAEAIGVAILMGGGPAVIYGGDALEALEQLSPA